ncbi:MAG: ComF family protein [Candidatus Gottesmanbacteria bacterium]|nr:ComF family protein [Candidatus Gottesmanbacteria bacterium]
MLNLLDLIFPKRCLTCWRFGKYFCDRCASTIRTIGTSETICPICERPAIGGITHPRCQSNYSLDGLTSIFRYDGIIKKAVKSLKYRRVTDLAREFMALIPPSFSSEVTKLRTNEAFLIPIPLHISRLRDRGFNQAEVLGRLLVDRLQIPIRMDILKRVKKTTPQVEMKDRKERLQNMKDVFSMNHLAIQPSSHIILFDDVFTTGATMMVAGETLKRAGARFVWAVTMAR